MRIGIKFVRHLALLLPLSLIPLLCLASTTAGSAHHYQLSIPDGWEQLPAAELAKFNASLPSKAHNILYDMALRPKGADSGYPYVLVQVFPPAMTHLSSLPNESQFNSIVRLFSQGGAVINDLKPTIDSIQNAEQREWTKGFMEKLAKSTFHADVAHRMFATIVDGPSVHGKRVTGMAVWRFASDGTLVQFNCYGWSGEFAKNRTDFARIVASYQELLK